MTRSEIEARILDGLNESPTSPVFFSAVEVQGTITEAAEVMAEETLAVKRTTHLALEEGTAYYSIRLLGPDALAPYRMWFVDKSYRLDAVSMLELDDRHRTWPTVSGDPLVWFPVSWDQFGLWPTPAAGGGILRVEFYAWPRALAEDGDRPELPDALHDALVVYGIYDGALKRWDEELGLNAWSLFVRSLRGGAAANLDRLRARTWRATADEGGGLQRRGTDIAW